MFIVRGVDVAEGLVVRFYDNDGKRRPAVVLAVLDVPGEKSCAYVIEGTTKDKPKQKGLIPLLEVVGGTPLQHAMGLSADVTTYFYPRGSAVKLLEYDVVLLGNRQCYALDADLRVMQRWVLSYHAACTDPRLVAARAAIIAAKHPTGETKAILEEFGDPPKA